MSLPVWHFCSVRIGVFVIGPSQNYSFFSHTRIHVRQTDKLRFIPPQILGSKSDRQTSYVSFHHSNLDPRKIDRRTKYISFHPSTLDPKETDKFHFISPLIIGIQERQTDGKSVSFHSSYLDPRKTDRRKNFISPRWARKPVNHSSWVVLATPTDRPKSVPNRCVIDHFCDYFVLSLCPFDISVGIVAFVIGPSQIFSFFLILGSTYDRLRFISTLILRST